MHSDHANRVHSSVVRAAGCRSAGPWFESGCALTITPAQCAARAHHHPPTDHRAVPIHPHARRPHIRYTHMRAHPATGSAIRAALHMGAPPPAGSAAVGQTLASSGHIRRPPLACHSTQPRRQPPPGGMHVLAARRPHHCGPRHQFMRCVGGGTPRASSAPSGASVLLHARHPQQGT